MTQFSSVFGTKFSGTVLVLWGWNRDARGGRLYGNDIQVYKFWVVKVKQVSAVKGLWSVGLRITSQKERERGDMEQIVYHICQGDIKRSSH